MVYNSYIIKYRINSENKEALTKVPLRFFIVKKHGVVL